MTKAQRNTVQFFILAALLFVGSSVSSEIVNSSLSEVDVNQVKDVEVMHNVSKKPTLQPKESKPLINTYSLQKGGKVCLMAKLGVEFVVKVDKKTLFYNLDPKSTKSTGYCADQKAVLSLEFDGGYLQFDFKKVADQAYVTTVKTLLEPEPSCKECKAQSYPGIMDHEKLFKTNKGKSFKCQSRTTLKMASNLDIKLVPLQIQAFDLNMNNFGKETECWSDYTRRILPIVLGAVIAGIILIAVLVYVLRRERRGQGYEQL